MRGIVAAEIEERRAAAVEYVMAHGERAAVLRQEADLLEALLDDA